MKELVVLEFASRELAEEASSLGAQLHREGMLHHEGAALAYRRDEGRVELVQPMQLALIDDAKTRSSTTSSPNGRTTTTTTAPRRPRRPNPLRTTPNQNPHPGVTDDHQLHITLEPPVGIEPTTYALREPAEPPTRASTCDFVIGRFLRDISSTTA